jgi:hypothetical protein
MCYNCLLSHPCSEIPIPLPFAIGKYTHDISKRKQFEIYEV